MYGIGTMFSMAVLAAMTSIALKAVIAIAAAHWATAIVNFLGFNVASGITEAAMQQGGVGLMLSLLILTVPTMAAQFFQGTLGNFMAYTQVDGGNRSGGGGDQRSRYEAATGGGAQRPVNPATVSDGGRASPAPNIVSGNAGPTTVTGGRTASTGDTATTGKMGAAGGSGTTSATGTPSPST